MSALRGDLPPRARHRAESGQAEIVMGWWIRDDGTEIVENEDGELITEDEP
ncbi:hypothetical protein [Amycolatopsis vastitatis]|uniref:hypothetical protein n=1 Tax=Amycolatopsis vastitatis TaxID=1905142 RepID=UPI001304105C|nr:hypothetical protein [Amycolatopsis vastitatis]